MKFSYACGSVAIDRSATAIIAESGRKRADFLTINRASAGAVKGTEEMSCLRLAAGAGKGGDYPPPSRPPTAGGAKTPPGAPLRGGKAPGASPASAPHAPARGAP